MISHDEKKILSEALSNGIDLQKGIDIQALTILIWESIALMPYPIESSFNIIGNSSVINITNEKKEVVLIVNIDKKRIMFKIPKPRYKRSRDDSVAIMFAAMSIAGIALNTCK